MKLFSLSLAKECPCAVELATLIYDLGHNLEVDVSESTLLQEFKDTYNLQSLDKTLDFTLTAFNSDAIKAPQEQVLYLSICHDTDEGVFAISCLTRVACQLVVLDSAAVIHTHAINGADIYEEVVQQLEKVVTTALTRIAQEQWSDLPVINTSDYSQQVDLTLLRRWHNSNETFTQIKSVEQNLYLEFVQAASFWPQKTAVIYDGQSYSYAQLQQKTESYAKALQNILAPQSLEHAPIIALSMPKSFELYACILAVLQLGGCYVPIDPEYPEERIRNILNSATPNILVTEQETDIETTHTISRKQLDELSLVNQDILINPLNLPSEANAVLIYTSGSTGTPKGVQLTHNNISHFCAWYCNKTQLDERANCLQFTTVSFDASLLDIFPTLFSGATLIVPTVEQRHDFSLLDKLINVQQVSHCFIPPAMLSMMPKYQWPSMRHIITGGDVCDNSSITHWSSQCNLLNIYGPTECTVLATCKSFHPTSHNKIIGKPIQNTRIYLLNEQYQPCQTMEQGELYIAGLGVGPGYVMDEQQTKQRFIMLNGERAYCTGDICYWDENGDIHFVGRKDNQLKIRGFRVELGEIENTILHTKLYNKCVVVADEKKQIRAFVSEPQHNATISTLKQNIEECLPQYMLPSHIIELDEFPATVNGKVDRQQLISIPIKTATTDSEETWGETELALRTIWAEALDMDEEDISLKASFFDLGGYSLLVSKMLLAVKNRFAGNFTLARFMENPSIEALTNLLSGDNLSKGAQISDRIYADMVLDFNIQPIEEVNPYIFSPRAVLLTGASGFLGAHILEQLVTQTDSIVYCLIRASSEEYALKKLYDTYRKFNLVHLVKNSRIRVLCGDLAQPKLGLEPAIYQRLENEIDVIYHNGALVNHIYDYDYLYDANVQSTIDLLVLACTGIQKQIVYTSTLSAASNINDEGRIIEDGPAGKLPAFVNNGYNLTKWVSEQLVWQCYERGLPVTLVRPGNICGHSATGCCFPDQNRILLLLKGSAQMGIAPDWELNFDLCPVDFIAKGMVINSLDKEKHAPVLHFHNPNPLTWKEYVGRLNHHNIPIRFIPDAEWRKKLLLLDESNALYQVVSFYLDENNEDIGDISNIDHALTLARIAQSGMQYPEKDHALVDANLGFLISSGFISQEDSSKHQLSNINE